MAERVLLAGYTKDFSAPIQTIKFIREYTGLGLADAKRIYDEFLEAGQREFEVTEGKAGDFCAAVRELGLIAHVVPPGESDSSQA